MNEKLINDTLDYLNDLLNKDRFAISMLTNQHVRCNQEIAENTLVQALPQYGTAIMNWFSVVCGMLGVDEDGYPFITYIQDSDGLISKFLRADGVFVTIYTGSAMNMETAQATKTVGPMNSLKAQTILASYIDKDGVFALPEVEPTLNPESYEYYNEPTK